MTVKSTALSVITESVASVTQLETEGASMTVAEVERITGTARGAIDGAIEALLTEYGIRAYDATTKLRTLAQRIQDLGAQVIDSGSVLADWTPTSEMPVVRIAHELYGDVERAEEIVRLNRLTNPNRVPAGRTLKVREA